MHWLSAIEHFLRVYATQVPLPWFVFIGSFLEELISPLTAALIMGTAGSLAFAQGYTLWHIFILALLASFGRTLGAWVYYFLGDKFENLISKKMSRFIGMKHGDIERIGERFTGHHWKDGGALFLMRATPFFPTTIVSVASGIIKINIKVFLIATYLGHIIKDFFFVYAGYVGLRTAPVFWQTLAPFRHGVRLFVLIVVLALIATWYFKYGPGRKKQTSVK